MDFIDRKATLIYREGGKKWELPVVVPFEGFVGESWRSECLYHVLGYREPKKGEYYLSGAICEAYKAPNDLPSKFLVVKPTQKVKTVQVYTPGEVIP